MPKTEVTLTQKLVLGPAMQALNPRQRAFVIALNNAGGKNRTEAARAAGYSDQTGHARDHANWLMHNPNIQAAIVEDARARFAGLVGANLARLEQIADTPGPSQLAAVKMSLHHAGLIEKTVSEHTHTVTVSLKDKMAEIERLCEITGDDPAKLLEDVPYDTISDIPATPDDVPEPEVW